MQSITITKPNTKGQVVIPKKIRDDLGIAPGTPLEVTKQGRGVYLVPLYAGEDRGGANEAWLDVLRETQGVWGPETKDEEKLRLARASKERERIKKLRNAW